MMPINELSTFIPTSTELAFVFPKFEILKLNVAFPPPINSFIGVKSDTAKSACVDTANVVTLSSLLLSNNSCSFSFILISRFS